VVIELLEIQLYTECVFINTNWRRHDIYTYIWCRYEVL